MPSETSYPVSNASSDFHSILKNNLCLLSVKFQERFQTFKQAFQYFDPKGTQFVKFTDFCYHVDELGMKFERSVILQIFTYLDKNKDAKLNVDDFKNLFNFGNPLDSSSDRKDAISKIIDRM